jgi:hypothetical protein
VCEVFRFLLEHRSLGECFSMAATKQERSIFAVEVSIACAA